MRSAFPPAIFAMSVSVYPCFTSQRTALRIASPGFSMPSTYFTAVYDGPLSRIAASESCTANALCSPTWSPKSVSGPRPTWSTPMRSTQCATCAITASRSCRRSFTCVVCGAASMPMTPPFSAIFLRVSSVFMRREFQSPRAPACVMVIGFALAEPVEHVDPIDLVLDGRRGLKPRHEGDPSRFLGRCEIEVRRRDVDHALVVDVGEAHAKIEEDVVPLPALVRGDRRGAVHEVLEHDVRVGDREPGVARRVATLPPLLQHAAHVLREDRGVVVHRDDLRAIQDRPCTLLLRRGELDLRRRHTVHVLRQRDVLVVLTRREIREGAIAVVRLLRHLNSLRLPSLLRHVDAHGRVR